MINVIRGEKPSSLDRPEIKQYLTDLIIYQEASEEERKKLRKPSAGDYREWDVLEAFDRDFYSKCYLSEEKFANSWSMDVEHFIPKSKQPALKYEWTNLYPCDHDANMSKPNIQPDGGYLDPCSAEDNVETEIIYELGVGGAANFYPHKSSNIKAINSSELLDRIHNGSDRNSKQKTANLRLKIKKKEDELIKLIQNWQKEVDKTEKEKFEQEIKNLLSRKSDFTMLLRSLDSVKKYLTKDFLD